MLTAIIRCPVIGAIPKNTEQVSAELTRMVRHLETTVNRVEAGTPDSHGVVPTDRDVIWQLESIADYCTMWRNSFAAVIDSTPEESA